MFAAVVCVCTHVIIAVFFSLCFEIRTGKGTKEKENESLHFLMFFFILPYMSYSFSSSFHANKDL